MNKTVEFRATPIRPLYNGDNFKIYACEIDAVKYPHIKLNNYNNASILGNFQELTIGVEYQISAIEETGKFGPQYKVNSIKRDLPTDLTSSKIFLEEILTPNQAHNLLESYPDIIDRVIKNKLDDIDLKKVYGIAEKTFEKIKRKIIENFALIDLVEKFKGLITLKVMKKLLEKYKTTTNIINNLIIQPYGCLTRLAGIGFKTADIILLKIDEVSKSGEPIITFKEELLTSEDRMRACILYVLSENESDGHTKMLLADLINKCESLTHECMNYFNGVIQEDKYIYYDDKTKYASRMIVYETELYIRDKILELLNVDNKWDIDCGKYEDVDETKLTDQQMCALNGVCENNLMVINGFAGTGKTATVSRITQMLKENNKRFSMFAPTGRAAKQLTIYSKLPASTIHRGLGFRPPNIWTHNESMPLSDDLVIIDETSMVDIFLMKHLLEAINPKKTKVLFVGDSDQIPSVGAGNVFHDIINSNMIPKTTLDKVFRFGEGGIMTASVYIRTSQRYLKNEPLQTLGTNKDYAFINCDQHRIIDNLKNIYSALITQKQVKPEDIFVLSAYNKGEYGTVNINNIIQKIANPLSIDGEGIKVGQTQYYKNDIVIQVVNNYEAIIYNEDYDNDFVDPDTTLIANGETGRIVDINKDGVIIQFDEIRIIYKLNQLINNIKLGYSISYHKCLTDDTWLLTNKGLKQLKELNNNADVNEFKDIEDDILIHNGEYLEKPKSFYNNGTAECLNIITKRNYEINCTRDHKIYYLSNDGYIKAKLAKDLKIGENIAIIKGLNVFGNKINLPDKWTINLENYKAKNYRLPNRMSLDFARFLGYMVADGFICNNSVRLSKRYKEVVVDFCRVIQSVFGYYRDDGIKHTDGKNGGFYTYDVSSVVIKDFCRNIDGIQPNDKFVPKCILESPKEFQQEFLKSVFEDGTVNLKKENFDHIEFSGKSEHFIDTLRMMLLNFGIISTKNVRYKKTKDKKLKINILYIYKKDAKIFYDNIGFISDFKNDRLKLCIDDKKRCENLSLPFINEILKKLTRKYKLKYNDYERDVIYRRKKITYNFLGKFISDFKSELMNDDDFKYLIYIYNNTYMDVIKDISGNTQDTYCLEMPNTHRFVQNGILGGNSQGSGCDYIIMLTPKAHTYFLNSNLIYVAETRTKKQCYHIGDYKTVNNCIQKKANFDRKTFLKDMLTNNVL